MSSPLAFIVIAWPIDCALLYALRAAWRATRKNRHHRRTR